tara:strand:+ start:10261 stop:10551 length:291 start_codon:yes stop_codon:yes gene_type:complete
VNGTFKPRGIFIQSIIGCSRINTLSVNANKNIQFGQRYAEFCSNNRTLQGNMFARGRIDNNKYFFLRRLHSSFLKAIVSKIAREAPVKNPYNSPYL